MTRGPLPMVLDVSLLSQSSELNLPEGWVVKERKRSLVEVETNIRTLGQLYRTLSDLKKQLPSPIATAVENNVFGSSSLNAGGDAYSVYGYNRRNSSFRDGDMIPVTPVDGNQQGQQQQYQQQHYPPINNDDPVASARRYIQSMYPSDIFEPLIQLHLACCTSCPSWRDPDQFLGTYRDGNLSPGLLYAIFAHSALHGAVCHPEEFNQPYLIPLAQDCYELACDLVEFDVVTTSTVEALVTMHLYCSLVSQQEDGRNNSNNKGGGVTTHFWLAKRHIECLDHSKWWAFRAWFRRIELATTTTTSTLTDATASRGDVTLKKPKKPSHHNSPAASHTNNSMDKSGFNQTSATSSPMSTMTSTPYSSASASFGSGYDQLKYQQRIWVYYEIKGWELIQESASVQSLQNWIEESMVTMDENDHDNDISTAPPLWQKLRLQTLYLAGILNRYQADMMDVFEKDNRWLVDDQVTDYFSVPTTTQNRIEQSLHRSMLAAFKLIQVALYSFKLNHRCLLPELIDIISAACTILYFGHKMTSDLTVTQQAEQALCDLVQAFGQEYGMLQVPRIYIEVEKWKSMVGSLR